jgi:hypothetical protein
MTIDATRVLENAERATGLSDFGGDALFEPSFRSLFAAMAHSVSTEAQLTDVGLRGAELQMRVIAEARLRFVDDRKTLPEITTGDIVKPVIILGLPRAGSTFLHSMLAQDPANRHPRTWEMLMPSPPPEPATYNTDPRIKLADDLLAAIGVLNETVTSLHPFGAEHPEECHLLMELMCHGDRLPGVWRMPGFNRLRNGMDIREGYLTHRMALQNLQHRHRGERWVLKNPGHIFYLDHLLAVYPDAHIIQTHRDPAKVLPSVTALLTATRVANSDAPIDSDRIAMGNLKAFASGLDKAIEFRRQPGMQDHFHDVHFRALIADPMATVREIYRRFDMPLSEAAVERMEHWLATDDSHAVKARYTLEQYGLNEAQVHEAFATYMAHYDIAPERKTAS